MEGHANLILILNMQCTISHLIVNTTTFSITNAIYYIFILHMTRVQTLTAAFFTGLAFSAFLLALSNSTSLQVLLKSISCM